MIGNKICDNQEIGYAHECCQNHQDQREAEFLKKAAVVYHSGEAQRSQYKITSHDSSVVVGEGAGDRIIIGVKYAVCRLVIDG